MEYFVESPSREGNFYKVDTEELTCTCMNFQIHRKTCALNDPLRLCKHLISVLVGKNSIPENLKPHENDIVWFAAQKQGFAIKKIGTHSGITVENKKVTYRGNCYINAMINANTFYVRFNVTKPLENQDISLQINTKWYLGMINELFDVLPKKHKYMAEDLSKWITTEYEDLKNEFEVSRQSKAKPKNKKRQKQRKNLRNTTKTDNYIIETIVENTRICIEFYNISEGFPLVVGLDICGMGNGFLIPIETEDFLDKYLAEILLESLPKKFSHLSDDVAQLIKTECNNLDISGCVTLK